MCLTTTPLDDGPRNRFAMPRSNAIHGMVESAHQESTVQSQRLIVELDRRIRYWGCSAFLDSGPHLGLVSRWLYRKICQTPGRCQLLGVNRLRRSHSWYLRDDESCGWIQEGIKRCGKGMSTVEALRVRGTDRGRAKKGFLYVSTAGYHGLWRICCGDIGHLSCKALEKGSWILPVGPNTSDVYFKSISIVGQRYRITRLRLVALVE